MARELDWITTTPEHSYRSIFRWGNPSVFKHPNHRLVEYMISRFSLSEKDLQPSSTGREILDRKVPVRLGSARISELTKIVGKANISVDTYDRVVASYGKTMIDLFRLRDKVLENIPDAVLYPSDAAQVARILKFAVKNRISINTKGAGSSVTRGFEAERGGLTLDLSRHMKRIQKLDPVNQTVTVEPGILLPDLESQLQKASAAFGSPYNYTLGHFPQSYEFATVGGAVVTRGAGQNSTYYGKIEHLVLSQHYVTPAGDIVTREIPAKSTGPDLDWMLMGSEGTFGILVSVTLKLHRYMPENTRRFSYMFKDFESALGAAREILQSEGGFPSVFRLSDPEETDIAMRLYGVHGSILDRALKVLGYRPQSRCLLLGTADGNPKYSSLVRSNVARIARRFGAFPTTSYVTKKWEHGRFLDPYMRDDLMDFGVIIDTLECSTSWANLPHVHSTVRKACHENADAVVMCHLSHLYPQGANLYFIFIARMNRKQFTDYHKKVVSAIAASGAAISHHHGIGRLLAPWMEKAQGPVAMGAIRSLKQYFDPAGTLNPGVLGIGAKKKR